jgi:type IV secretion system protein VirB9
MIRPSVVLSAAMLLMSATAAQAQATREVTYNAREVVHLNAKLRFTTLIILPEQEQILDFVCGDKEFWMVSGAQNLAYVKPAKAGAATNLNLVTASGNVYSFLLTEGTADADLKVYVLPDDSLKGTGDTLKRFYTGPEVEALRQAAETARKDAQAARDTSTKTAEQTAKTVDDRVNAFKASYPTRLDFPFRYAAHQKPFFVAAIYTDGAFTYIKSDATELPSLYEIRDGKPNLVNFQVEHGTYIVPKVLEKGYLAIGKQKFVFERGAAR